MTIIANIKILILICLLAGTIGLATISADQLSSIYQSIGNLVGLKWIISHENHIRISDLGHGVMFFIIMLTVLSMLDKIAWSIIFAVVGIVGLIELSQLFVTSRTTSLIDFAYGFFGIVIAVVTFYLYKKMQRWTDRPETY